MTIEEMKKRKAELEYTNEAISLLSGVPLSTVAKIFGGVTTSPRYTTLMALERALSPEPETLVLRDPHSSSDLSLMEETDHGRIWSRQGTYTLKDYLALPDDIRVELIDGVFYDMSSPVNFHQFIAGEIHRVLATFLRKKKGPCMPFIAPADVQLDCDDKTIVQPDVFVVCNREKIPRNRVIGAPDLVIEILSPSTRKKDITIKTAKYMNAGVREYWIVDPMRLKVLVYLFNDRNYENMYLYGFDQKVPVGIWNGECEVDFADIHDYLSDWIDEE